jgi:hypothetical protein
MPAAGRGAATPPRKPRRCAAFAAARRPGNGDVLSALNLQVDACERMRFHLIRVENLRYAIKLD